MILNYLFSVLEQKNKVNLFQDRKTCEPCQKKYKNYFENAPRTIFISESSTSSLYSEKQITIFMKKRKKLVKWSMTKNDQIIVVVKCYKIKFWFKMWKMSETNFWLKMLGNARFTMLAPNLRWFVLLLSILAHVVVIRGQTQSNTINQGMEF